MSSVNRVSIFFILKQRSTHTIMLLSWHPQGCSIKVTILWWYKEVTFCNVKCNACESSITPRIMAETDYWMMKALNWSLSTSPHKASHWISLYLESNAVRSISLWRSGRMIWWISILIRSDMALPFTWCRMAWISGRCRYCWGIQVWISLGLLAVQGSGFKRSEQLDRVLNFFFTDTATLCLTV